LAINNPYNLGIEFERTFKAIDGPDDGGTSSVDSCGIVSVDDDQADEVHDENS